MKWIYILVSNLQANNMIVGVAGNMEPSTRVNKSRVPALKDVVGIRKSGSESMKCVTFRVC